MRRNLDCIRRLAFQIYKSFNMYYDHSANRIHAQISLLRTFLFYVQFDFEALRLLET